MARPLQRVLVTGGAGYVGSNLVPKLLAAGYGVTVLDLYIYSDTLFAPYASNPLLRQVKGDLADKRSLRAALKSADFRSLRGAFKFNTNHYPIQDFYLVKVAKRADGKFQTEIVKKILEQDADAYAKDCPMK